ncbi:MAG: chromate efflux transporter [Sulfuritalea sp.]|nr:chromate efflux transporter [Sulfuritalea sp.]
MAEDLIGRGGADRPAAMLQPSLRDLFSAFFRVGLTSFGMAILQNLKTMSLRRGFVSEAEIEEGIALVQLYPGPIMVDLVAFIGYRRRGAWGAIFAVGGFLLPATVLMLVLAAAYQRYGNLPQVAAMLPGLTALVIGVVLSVTLDIARKNIVRRRDVLLALLAFAIGALGGNMLWAVAAGIGIGAAGWRHEPGQANSGATAALSWRRLAPPLLLGAGLLAIAFALAFRPGTMSDLALAFMKIGSIAFGNGATILPIMQQVVVDQYHWLDGPQFAAAIALGQITPGPILNSATFVGYQVAGLAGALAATAAIFAPSVVMTMVFTELFVHVRHLAPIRAAIRGVMASFVGMLVWVAVSLGQSLADRPVAWLLVAAAMAALRILQWDTIRLFAVGLLLWAAALQSGLA